MRKGYVKSKTRMRLSAEDKSRLIKELSGPLDECYKQTQTMYVCGVSFQHEMGEEGGSGKHHFYNSIEEMKQECRCWESCGILEVNVTAVKWHVKQDLSKAEKVGPLY